MSCTEAFKTVVNVILTLLAEPFEDGSLSLYKHTLLFLKYYVVLVVRGVGVIMTVFPPHGRVSGGQLKYC
jgi:hypothetical protein